MRGFQARRQFSEAITFNVHYRTKDGRQRLYKIGRFGVFTPAEARAGSPQRADGRCGGERPSAANSASSGAPPASPSFVIRTSRKSKKGASAKRSAPFDPICHGSRRSIKPKQLGRLKVISISQDDVEKFMQLDLSPGSARRVVNLLSGIFAYAIKKKLRSNNPCHGIDLPEQRKRLRRLSAAEYAQLNGALENGDNPTADIFLLLAISGWRSSEAKDLKWSEVDLSVTLHRLAIPKLASAFGLFPTLLSR